VSEPRVTTLPTGASRVDRGGLVGALLLTSALGTLGWVRHSNFWSGAFDLGIFDQAVWQLSHGRATISFVERNVFADHFSPVLLLFVPLYWVAASPLWLLGGQAVALGATVLPMRALARDRGVAAWAATALVCASAPLLAAATFDFHPSTLAVPAIATMVLYALRDRPWAAAIAAVAVILCRADLGLVIVATAIVSGRRCRLPLVVVGLAGAAAGSALPGMFGETNGWVPHFGHLGSGPSDALLHPWDVAEAFLSNSSLRPLLTWVLAAGVLVVLRARWMLALVVAGLPVLLSRWGATAEPWFHYGAPMAPVAIAGTIVSLDPSQRGWRVFRELRPVVVAGGVVVALLLASPLSPSAPDQFRVWDVVRPSTGRDSAAAVRLVRDGEVVSADNRLAPHLAHRERIYLFPLPFAMVEGFFAEGSEPDLADYPPDLVDVVLAPDDTVGLEALEGYTIVERVLGFVVLRRE
jgi:uncharacterized membrane protein